MTHHGNNDPWPHAQVQTLKKLWLEGKSGAEIASVLPGRTRCSVIAKVHRLGLEGRGAPAQLTGQATRKPPSTERDRSTGANVQNIAARTPPKPGQQNRPAVAFGNIEVVNAAETEKRRAAQKAHGAKIINDFQAPANDTAIPLMERGRYQCAWPVGEPDRPADQMCCGAPADPEAPKTTQSYCPTHRARASSGIPKMARAPREYSPAGQRRADARSVWDGARVA